MIHKCKGKTAFCLNKFIKTRVNQKYCVACSREFGEIPALKKEITTPIGHMDWLHEMQHKRMSEWRVHK